MIDFHTLASKLDSKGYRGLRRLSALDWYIQFAVRRDCFEFAGRWNRDHDEYSRPYPQYAKALEMIRRKPIVSIPDIVNSGFRLSDFFDLAGFFLPDANGQYDIHRPAQPILHRHLPRLRLTLREAAQESFRRALGTSLSDQTIMKLVDEWMSGKCELPQSPDNYNKPITSTDFIGEEFLRIDTSASDKDISVHLRAYLGQLATRIERKRSQKVTVPGNLPSRRARSPVPSQGKRRATSRDAYSIWTNLCVLPCMDMMLVAALQGDPEISDGTIGNALSLLFKQEWTAARARITRRHVSEMLAPCGRLYAELERAAFDEYVEKRNSGEFREIAVLIDHEIRLWNEEFFG